MSRDQSLAVEMGGGGWDSESSLSVPMVCVLKGAHG